MAQSNYNYAVPIRDGENINISELNEFLKNRLPNWKNDLTINQFPSGFSNLTYLLKAGEKEFVLRRPPFGANIKSAHDMHREYNMLRLIKNTFPKVPEPVLYCADESVIGANFYIMEKVNGLILRTIPPKDIALTPALMESLSKSLIDNLVELHSIDVTTEAFAKVGKPVGYIQRQVEGWIKRYRKAATEEIGNMEFLAEWLPVNMPQDGKSTLIHNDYKYDNVVFNAKNLPEITAVLDWEMATVGEPLMDLGTTLAYWADEDTHPALKAFSLTALPGNLNRQQLVERYVDLSGRGLYNIVFFYAYASFKVAVICQQIYARYQKGITKDPRFAGLIHLVKACAHNAQQAIHYDRISYFS